MPDLLAILAQAPKPGSYTRLLLFVGIGIVSAIALGIIWMQLRKRLLNADDDTETSGSMLDSLRAMRDKGEMSDAEFNAAKAALTAKMKENLERKAAARAKKGPTPDKAALRAAGLDPSDDPPPQPRLPRLPSPPSRPPQAQPPRPTAPKPKPSQSPPPLPPARPAPPVPPGYELPPVPPDSRASRPPAPRQPQSPSPPKQPPTPPPTN